MNPDTPAALARGLTKTFGTGEARVEAGMFRLDLREGIDLVGLVHEAVRRFRPDIKRAECDVTLDAPASARIKVATPHGTFEFGLGDVTEPGTAHTFLQGKVSVTREEGAVRLTRGVLPPIILASFRRPWNMRDRSVTALVPVISSICAYDMSWNTPSTMTSF